jgi:site-specific recombinase XerD
MITNILNRGCLHTSSSMIALQAYEARLIGEGKSKRTMQRYREMAGRFEAFKGEQPLSQELVLNFRDHLAKGVKGNSIIPHITALNHYLGYLGHVEMRIKPPRWQDKRVTPLDREEVRRLVSMAGEDPDPELALRNKAMLSIFSDGAARVSEVCALRISDLELTKGKLWARATKSGADRPIYVSEPTVQAISAYLQARPEPWNAKDEDILFLSKQRQQMNPQSVRDMVHMVAARAGIQKRVWPHLLRHSRLTQLGEDGASAYEIKEIAGHHTLDMSIKYVHISETTIRRSMQARPMIIADAPKEARSFDPEKAKVELAMRLAAGEIDAESFKMAVSTLLTSPQLEALR